MYREGPKIGDPRSGLLAIAMISHSADAKQPAQITGRTYAFIGLERTAGVMVYDVSDRFHPSFVQYLNTSPDDISPEGLLFIKEDDSPNGKPILVVSHEISSTTTIFEITKK